MVAKKKSVSKKPVAKKAIKAPAKKPAVSSKKGLVDKIKSLFSKK